MTTMRCPVCGRTFADEQSSALPFCSPRCKQVDLARWLGEAYSVPYVPEEDEPEEPRPSDDGDEA